MKPLYCVSIVLMMLSSIYAGNIPARCHDPSLAGHRGALRMSEKRFLLISGAGAGIGNFLIFFPAAYYFAALTGRVRGCPYLAASFQRANILYLRHRKF